MKKLKKGDHVKTKDGRHGKVHAVHQGTFYHIAGVGFFPPSHVEPDNDQNATPSNPDPDRDGDNDLAHYEMNPEAAEHLAFMRDIQSAPEEHLDFMRRLHDRRGIDR